MAETGSTEGKIYTFDQLIRQRAVDEDQTPLLAYPRSKLGVTDFELVSGKLLDRWVDGAAHALIQAGLAPVFEDTVVGVYSPSNLDYLINIYALGRLGYTSFLISPRLPATIVATLLNNTNARILVHSTDHRQLALTTGSLTKFPLQTIALLQRSEYSNNDGTIIPVTRDVDPLKEQYRQYIILHSSGSTGVPKPVPYSNARLIIVCLPAPGLIGFQSLPFSHAHGLVTYSQAIWSRKTHYFFNSNVPHTNKALTAAINASKPEIVWTVPYVLKLLAESDEGIEALKRCRIVSSSGSRCPDELGDMLTERGVFLGCLFGSSENSLLFTSLYRPRDDKAWNYLRPPPFVLPYLLMQPVEPGSDVCECIVLDGHRAKQLSNSDSPPNSFHTSDLFIAHPTIANAWKFLGRSDDRVTLLNGEKVLPLPIEGAIVQHPLVKEAVVFGVDRPVPGLLLFKSLEAGDMGDEEALEKVWPTIEEANSRSEAFSQIGKDMVIVLDEQVPIPSTDKSTFKRAQVYLQFADIINQAYDRLESNEGREGTLVLDLPQLEDWLISKFQDLGFSIDTKTDFFAAGIDSLKAVQMRGLIIKYLALGGKGTSLASMAIYESGNVQNLAKKLLDLRTGDHKGDGEDDIKLMEELIERYSTLPKFVPKQGEGSGKAVVVLTGATGFLGAHVLAELVSNPTVTKVICLVRSSSQPADVRLSSALQANSLPHIIPSQKVSAIDASLPDPNLGLQQDVYNAIQKETTHIVHCAWAVNFSIPLASFTPQLQGLQNLLSLSLGSPTALAAKLLFCSSVSAALGTGPTAVIPSAALPDLHQASPTGYGRSKLVAEKVLERASQKSGACVRVLRIGQITPSREAGRRKLWNTSEMIPLLVRSAAVIKALPDRSSAGGEESCRWIEVDVVATSIIDVCGFSGGKDKGGFVYNIVHPSPFSWEKDFLPKLREAGMHFDTVGYAEWLEKLRTAEADVEKNPSQKLLGFWEAQSRRRGTTQGAVTFDTRSAVEISLALKNAARVVDGQLVKEMVDAWREAGVPI